MADVTVGVFGDGSGADLELRLVQSGVNVLLNAVDAEGNPKSFGVLLVFEGEHGGHVEVKTQVIADSLGLERDANQHMKIIGP